MAKKPVRVGLVQMCSTTDVEANLQVAEKEIRRAAAAGAGWILLPENFIYLRSEGDPLEFCDRIPGRLSRFGSALARELGVWLSLGSFPQRPPRAKKARNTSLVFNPRGKIVARYDKLHRFDIEIEGGPVFHESATIAAGNSPIWFDGPWGRTGLSICYDLRFPELYRKLTFAGATVLCVPSAFTAYTGAAHWMELLRARAIENLCWVLAPAQVGRHSAKRESFGHSTVIDPWGKVVALKRRGLGVLMATLDPSRTEQVRRGLPALRHIRRDLLRSFSEG